MLIHIVPRLPPTISGVGDYALELAKSLRQEHSLDGSFVVCDPGYRDTELDGFQVKCIPQFTDEALFSVCNWLAGGQQEQKHAVLIHYVGYGYQPRGAPLWFLRALQRLKRGMGAAAESPRLLTVFHELYAMGRPWESSFWLSPVQRFIARDIARMSDGILTNRAASAEWLARARGARPSLIRWLPVFSNVGEPTQLSTITERSLSAVIWGSPETRQAIYRREAGQLRDFCRAQGIRELHDIGPTIGAVPRFSDDIHAVSHGVLPSERIAEVLVDARFGIFDCHPRFVTKSGIYAAYRAYGLVPVHASARTGSAAESTGAPPLLSLSSATHNLIHDEELIKWSESARNSYGPHRISEHARMTRRLLLEDS